MNDDLISRQAVEEIINDIRDCISVEGYCAILERLKKLRFVNSKEPKTGYWIEHPTEEDYSVCSRCGIGSRRMEHGKNPDGTKYIDIYSYRFCPYCGARMAESEEAKT